MTAAVLAFPTDQEAPAGTVTSQDVVARSGASYRQVDYWTRVGLLEAVYPDGRGSGYRRFHPVAEVAVVALAVRLSTAGLDVRVAFDHARRLLVDGATTLAGITLHLPEEP